MRRYGLRLRPVCALASVAIWWDPNEHRYVCALTQRDGQVRYETYGQLRDAVHWQSINAIFDDRLLRALLKDRATGAGTRDRP